MHFSPNGDGVQDFTELLFTPVSAESTVTIDVAVVRVSDGTVVDSLLTGASLPAGTEADVPWSPGSLADGRYRFDIGATDGTGTAQASAEVVADSTPPVVDLRGLSQDPFDPQVKSLTFQVEVQSDSTTTTIASVFQLGARVDSIGTSTGPVTRTFTWDGNRLAGGNAASGRYDLVAVSSDLAGNSGMDTQTVTLDRDAPAFAPDHPDTVGTTSFPLLLTGVVTDSDRVEQVKVSFDSAQTFVPVDFMSAPGDTVQYRTSVTDPAPQPGRRRVVLRALDAFGHVTDLDVVVAYDTFFPVSSHTVLVGNDDGRVADGDSVIVETLWDAAGLTVRADFSDLDSGSGTQVVTDAGLGYYLIRHRISPTNTKAPGLRRIVVTASTGFLSSADTLEVVLVDRHGGDLVSIDRNRFDPLAGEKVTIAGAVANRALRVEIYDLSGHRVRLLEANGFVEWDGQNDEGAGVASGVYLLKVRFGDAGEVRKVAVLRGTPDPGGAR